mgnify:FL=1
MELKQYERGQLVKSTAGHDKGIVAVIIAVESEEYVLLADGKTRPVNKPKRKKVKHIEPIGKTIESELLDACGGITDGALRNKIKLILK